MHGPSAVAVCFISSSLNFTCSAASGLCSTPTKSVLSAYPDAPVGSLSGLVISDVEQRQETGTFRAAEVCGRGDE